MKNLKLGERRVFAPISDLLTPEKVLLVKEGQPVIAIKDHSDKKDADFMKVYTSILQLKTKTREDAPAKKMSVEAFEKHFKMLPFMVIPKDVPAAEDSAKVEELEEQLHEKLTRIAQLEKELKAKENIATKTEKKDSVITGAGFFQRIATAAGGAFNRFELQLAAQAGDKYKGVLTVDEMPPFQINADVTGLDEEVPALIEKIFGDFALPISNLKEYGLLLNTKVEAVKKEAAKTTKPAAPKETAAQKKLRLAEEAKVAKAAEGSKEAEVATKKEPTLDMAVPEEKKATPEKETPAATEAEEDEDWG